MARVLCEDLIARDGRGIDETASLINVLLHDRCSLRTISERLNVSYPKHRKALRNFIKKYCEESRPKPTAVEPHLEYVSML